MTSSRDGNFTHFEHMDCDVEVGGLSVRLAVIYRPPPSKDNGLRTSVFLDDEWPAFLANYATISKDIVIVGDMNFHLDVVDNRDAQRFTGILDACGLQQHVCEPTHVRGHTLDVVITRDTSSIVSDVEVTDPGLCDHLGRMSRDHIAVTLAAVIIRPAPIHKTASFRKLRSIDADTFITDSTAMHYLMVLWMN
jgi:hypothetical protein